MWLRHARSACSLWLSSADQDAFEGWHDGHMRLGAGGVSLKLVVPRVENAIHQVQRASVVPIGLDPRAFDRREPACTIIWRARLSGLSRLRSEAIFIK